MVFFYKWGFTPLPSPDHPRGVLTNHCRVAPLRVAQTRLLCWSSVKTGTGPFGTTTGGGGSSPRRPNMLRTMMNPPAGRFVICRLEVPVAHRDAMNSSKHILKNTAGDKLAAEQGSLTPPPSPRKGEEPERGPEEPFTFIKSRDDGFPYHC